MKNLPSHFYYGMSSISIRGISSPVTFLINQQKSNLMKKRLLQFVIVLMTLAIGQLNAQVTGTKNIPGDYADLNAAFTDLNNVGVGAGGAIINIVAGNTQTCPTDGFQLGSAILNASLSATNTLAIQGNGNTVNAWSGTRAGSQSSGANDGMFVFKGVDYCTVQNLVFQELAGNTTNTLAMENAIAYYNFGITAGSADGCQFNTITGCSFNLNNYAVNGGAVFVAPYQFGGTTAATWTAGSGDVHKNLTVTLNNFANIYSGVVIRGISGTNAQDFTITNNTLANIGGGATTCYGLYTIYADNIAFNNNTASGDLAQTTTNYIAFTSTNCGGLIQANNNQITLQNGVTTSSTYGIYLSSNIGLSRQVNNNTINFGSFPSITSGIIYAVYATYSGGNSSILFEMNGNNISNQTLPPTSGTMYLLYNSASSGGNRSIQLNSNIITNNTKTNSGTIYVLYAGTADNVEVGNNTVSNFTYTNNSASGSASMYCVYASNSALAHNFHHNTISNINISGTSTSTSGVLRGIYSYPLSTTAVTIANNTINDLAYNIGTHTGVVTGIYTSASATQNMFNNKVYNLKAYQASGQAYGFYITAGTTVNLYNNYIGNLETPNANAAIPLAGIYISGGTTYNVDYNTIYLNTSSNGALFGSTAIYASTTPTVTFRNNIFVNLSTSVGATGYTTAYRRSSTTLTSYGANSNNNLFYAGLPCGSRLLFYDGTNLIQTLSAYKALVAPRDANSVSEEPPFLSTSGSSGNFLHINPAIPTLLESGGIPVAGITSDYDGDARNATTPDIGADEFSGIIPVACAGTPTPGIAAASPATICANQSANICISGMTAATGISIQWKSSTTPGGPYTDISCAGTTCFNTGPLAVGTYYYIATITCVNSGLSANTNEVTVTVLGNPTIVITPSAPNACAGTPTTLTASGASTYTWSPATGLNTTTGDVVIATPAVTTTYTVTGANQAGCTSTATVTVTILPVPTITATATPATICVGGSSQLQATTVLATMNQNYSLSSLTGQTYAQLTGAGITIIDEDAELTPGMATGNQDDGGVVINLPFTFTYKGNTFTQMSMCTNGWVGAGNWGTIDATNSRAGGNLFTSTIPNNTIAAWFKDMGANFPTTQPGTGPGSMRHGLIGTDIYAFQWDQAVGSSFSISTTTLISFQINIYGPASTNPGRIELIYGPTLGTIAFAASIGIEDGIGGTDHYINALTGTGNSTNTSTAWPGNGNGYRFDPVSTNVTWSPATFLNSTTIPNPIASNVTATTIYTAMVTASNGCSVTDTAKVTTYIIEPTFLQLGPYCKNSTPGTLPTTSLNGITGTWSPATISTSTIGSTDYIFTPNPNQCADTTKMIIIVRGPILSETHILPTSCLGANGSIDLTVTGTGPYTYSWIGPNGYTANTQDLSNLNGGYYYVTVTDGNTCSNILTVNLDLNPSCLACPVLGNLTAVPPVICQGQQSALTVNGLVGLGVTYGISFVYSSTALSATQLYGGSGIPIATISNANLGGGGTFATTTYTFNTSGNLYLYAILSPTPPDQTCRPVSVSTITVNSLPPVPIVQNITTCVGGSTLIVPTTTGGGTSTVSNIFTWDFEGGITGGGVSQYPAIASNGPAQTVGAGITMSAQGAGSGCTAAVTTTGYNVAPGNTLADAKTSGDYIEFCIGSAVAPSVFSGVTAINWANRASGTGPINYVLVASNDINTTLLSGTVTPGGTSCEAEGGSIPLNPATCYRIYYYSATNVSGTLRIDNLTITASYSSPYSGGTFNFYSNATLTNKVAGPVASYDPMTTPANSPQTIWVTQINTVTGCESAAVPVVITVYSLPTAEAGNNQFYCGLPASITISATSNYNGQWTQTGGAGTIASPTSKTTTYTTNAADIGKTVVFTWTTITPQGACANATDQVGLTTVRPTADAQFAYALDEYCPGSANPTVTHTTGVDGIYTYTVVSAGPTLTLNKFTGEINMASSQAGTYNVTNHVDGRGNLIITGVVDGPLSGGLPKAIELYAIKDIYDLGRYGIESANNGGGSAGVPEFVFPQGQFVAAGTRIWISADSPQFVSFFGFAPTFINNVAQINGDDAVVLYNDGQVIDVFGQVSYPANSPLAWIYEDGWAYRKNSTTNDGTVFNINNWNFSGRDALDNAVTNASAITPWPINSFVTTLSGGCNNNSHLETVTVGDLIPPTLVCPANIGVVLDPGDCSAYVHWDDPVASDNCVTNLVIEQIGGPIEGSEFTMNGSPYIIEYQTTANNQTVTCEFTITIYGYPEPIVGQLACNDTVQVSLDKECEIHLNADMFLEGGPYQCYNDFQLYVNSPLYNGVDITNLPVNLAPGVYIITVGDAANTLNTCNTVMVLKDKYPPEIICNCPVGGDSQNGGYSENCILDGCYDPNYNYNLPAPSVIEYCDYTLKLLSTEILEGPTCGTQLLRKTWRATDIGGNTSECTQEYYFKGFDLANMTWPKNYDDLAVNNKMLECDATYPVDELGNPHPSFTGYPSGSGTCKLVEVFYDDVMYPLTCGTKILRNWIVVDDCKGEVYTHTQIIRITDRKAPTFCQPEIFKVNTKAYSCDANVIVPAINCLEDNCCNDLKWWVGTSQNFQISGDLNGNGYIDNNEQWKLMNVPVGVYELRYYAKDCCDNVETKGVLFEVYDGIPPIATCEQFKTVSLSVYGEAKIAAVDFNSGSFDNCKPVYFKALRVNNNFEYDGGCLNLNGDDNDKTATIDVWYDDEVFFCCNDLTNKVMVGMRVFEVDPGVGPVDPRRYVFGGDLYGHYNDCWSVVTVECKVPPALTCPAIEVSCEESLDPNINPKLWPQVTYICNVDLSYTDVRDNNVCSGNVTRTWTAKSCDKTSQCKQSIKINPSTPFDPCTIVFPADKQVHCTNQLPDGGVPTWDEYPCNVVTAEVIKEDTFNFVEGSCKKILREWAVIDWCVYKANVGAEANIDAITSARKLNCNSLVRDGYYRYTQELRVVDFIPPTIQTEDQCIGFTEGCFAEAVKLHAFASDSCNTNEEYWWKYVVINMDNWDTIQYSYNYLPKPLTGVKGTRSRDKLDKTATSTLELLNPIPGGIYKVVWTVGDGCGNANKAEQIFTVVDRKAPTPVMVNIATSTMVNCQLEVCAIMFDKGGCNGSCISSFDNCTPKEELYFTFTPVLPKLYIDPVKWANQYSKYSRYFYDPVTGLISTEDKYLHGEALAWDPVRKTSCKFFGIGSDGYGPDHTQILEVYVWDKFAANEDCDDNNYDFAVVVLSINTEGDGCPEPGSLVNGSINNCVYENGLQEVFVNLDNGIETKVSMTAADGNFSANVSEGSYNITARKQVSGIPGLTTLDLVIIQKHVLGLKPVKDYCKLASMDINGDGKITASDILSGRKLILGYTEPKLNYNFLSNSYISENINNPQFSLKDAYNIKLNVEKGTNYNDIDFSGVMTGDVNNSVGFVEGRNDNNVKLMIDELELINGESYEIPVYVSGISECEGMQFELSYEGFDVKSINSDIMDISKLNFKLDKNALKFSWSGNNLVVIDENAPLFTISIEATSQSHLNNALKLNNETIKSEIYRDEEVSNMKLEFRNTVGTFALHQNIPNPFSDKAVIGFDLPEENTYSLSIYDLTGKIVKEISGYGKSGYNSVNVSRKDIGGNGVFYYRLKSGDNTDTKKMILIQ